MVAIPFCGQAYADKTLTANAQECVNLYPVLSPTADDPQRIILYPTPGYNYLSSGLNANFGPIRGTLVINNSLYFITGSSFVLLDPSIASFTVLGTLNTLSGRCSITCNTVEIIISDGTNGYLYNLATQLFTTISGGAWPTTGGVTNVTYHDGYVLAALNNSKTIIQSDALSGGSYGAQAFASVTSFPDNLVAVFSDGLQLYCFGPKLTEARYNAASTPFAFQKVQGVLIQAGCAARDTIVKVAGTVIWLADDSSGSPYVAALNGYSPTVFSTPPVNEAIAAYLRAGETISDAFANTYREGDTQFYVITFPSVNGGNGETWAVDVTLKNWHKRLCANGFTGLLPDKGRDLAEHIALWQNLLVVGTSYFQTGEFFLYAMSQDTSNDPFNTGTGSLTRIRTCQHVDARGRAFFIDELEIFCETGVGIQPIDLTAIETTEAADPRATLQISRDRGRTWVTVGTRSLGQIGQYKTRVRWTRLGRFVKAATFRIIISDAVRVFILGAEAKIRPGTK